MMRITWATLIVLFGAMQTAAYGDCITISDVIEYAKYTDQTITYLFLEDRLPDTVVFASPDRQKFMMVGYHEIDMCVNYHRVLTREQFQDWLNGEQQR